MTAFGRRYLKRTLFLLALIAVLLFATGALLTWFRVTPVDESGAAPAEQKQVDANLHITIPVPAEFAVLRCEGRNGLARQ